MSSSCPNMCSDDLPDSSENKRAGRPTQLQLGRTALPSLCWGTIVPTVELAAVFRGRRRGYD